MSTVEKLKNRLEEIRIENRTLAKRQRPIADQTADLFFEAGFEAAINFLQQNLQQCNVLSCKELLIPMQHREYEDIGAESNTDFKNTRADNRFRSVTHVLHMIDEL